MPNTEVHILLYLTANILSSSIRSRMLLEPVVLAAALPLTSKGSPQLLWIQTTPLGGARRLWLPQEPRLPLLLVFVCVCWREWSWEKDKICHSGDKTYDYWICAEQLWKCIKRSGNWGLNWTMHAIKNWEVLLCRLIWFVFQVKPVKSPVQSCWIC